MQRKRERKAGSIGQAALFKMPIGMLIIIIFILNYSYDTILIFVE